MPANEITPYALPITNIDSAKAFIDQLHVDGNLWHFDDNPFECGFTRGMAKLLRTRQQELWAVVEATGFDHFGYALDLMNPEWKD